MADRIQKEKAKFKPLMPQKHNGDHMFSKLQLHHQQFQLSTKNPLKNKIFTKQKVMAKNLKVIL